MPNLLFKVPSEKTTAILNTAKMSSIAGKQGLEEMLRCQKASGCHRRGGSGPRKEHSRYRHRSRFPRPALRTPFSRRSRPVTNSGMEVPNAIKVALIMLSEHGESHGGFQDRRNQQLGRYNHQCRRDTQLQKNGRTIFCLLPENRRLLLRPRLPGRLGPTEKTETCTRPKEAEKRSP